MVKQLFLYTLLIFALLLPPISHVHAQEAEPTVEDLVNIQLLPNVQHDATTTISSTAESDANAPMPQTAPETHSTDFVPGELLVGLHRDQVLAASTLTTANIQAVNVADPCASAESNAGIQRQLWRILPGQEQAVIAEFSSNPAVAYITPNLVVHASSSPFHPHGQGTATLPEGPRAVGEVAYVVNDPLYQDEQWYMQRINASRAWALVLEENGSASELAPVQVAIIDSGINITHPEFGGRIITGTNYINPNLGPTDDFGHGSHVAGMIGAAVNNGAGIAGVAPWVTFDARKVLNNFGSGSIQNVSDSICEAADAGARIINLSLETGTPNVDMHRAIQYAHDKGVLLIASTGNFHPAPVQWPAAYPEVMAVAATDYDDQRTTYSSMGSEVEIAAPGGDTGRQILSTWANSTVSCPGGRVGDGDYCYRRGTSMSAALVSGAAALIWGLRPEFSASQVRALLLDSATPISEGPTAVGRGRLDVHAAVRQVLESDLQLAQTLNARNLPPGSPSYELAVVLENPSTDPIDWQASYITETTWLTTTSVLMGKASYGAPATVSMVISPTNLAPGIYTASVKFSGTRSDASRITRNIPLNFLIGANIQPLYMPYLNTGTPGATAQPAEATTAVPSSWETLDVLGRTRHTMTDEASLSITLPITFPLKSNLYTAARINSNGFISFPNNVSANNRENVCLVNTRHSYQAIYGWWADLNPGHAASEISTFQPTANKMVIEFADVPTAIAISPTYTVTFQIVLYDDGRVGLNYRDVPAIYESPPDVTVGVEGEDGRFHNQIVCVDGATQFGLLPRPGQSFIFKPEDIY